MFNKVLYWIMVVIAGIIYTRQRLQLAVPELVNNYVNDLLCIPLVLGALTFLMRRLKKDKNFTFPLLFVIFLATYYSFYFEYYLPKVNPRYTADWIDVVLYFIGAIVYFLVEKKKQSMSHNEE